VEYERDDQSGDIMKRSITQTLSAVLATLLLGSFVQAADSPTKEQEALMQSERDWAKAWTAKDMSAVDWEADEYVFTNFDGKVSDRASDVADLKSSTFTISYEVDGMKAMVFGDTGVVVGHQTQKGRQNGQDIGGVFRFTDTWVKRDGHWRCVASQLTRIEKP
jgi:hypothetical protein